MTTWQSFVYYYPEAPRGACAHTHTHTPTYIQKRHHATNSEDRCLAKAFAEDLLQRWQPQHATAQPKKGGARNNHRRRKIVLRYAAQLIQGQIDGGDLKVFEHPQDVSLERLLMAHVWWCLANACLG